MSTRRLTNTEDLDRCNKCVTAYPSFQPGQACFNVCSVSASEWHRVSASAALKALGALSGI